MGSRTLDPPVYAVPPQQYYSRTPVSPVLPDMAPTSVDAGSVRRKPLHRMSTLSQHLSSSLRHNTSSAEREKGIQEPSVVQLPPTPDSETTTDTDRESGIQDVDQGPPASKMQRRKSRLSMLIPSFFFSPDAADQQGTGLKGTTGASRKQQRPVTASPAPAANYANAEAQQAASVSDVHNKNMVIYHNPAANYSSPDGLLLGRNNSPGAPTTNSSSPPLSSLQSGVFSCSTLSCPLSSYLYLLSVLSPTNHSISYLSVDYAPKTDKPRPPRSKAQQRGPQCLRRRPPAGSCHPTQPSPETITATTTTTTTTIRQQLTNIPYRQPFARP
nr:hypothetical protein B14D6.660 [imported] - Neurospora crassa [Neurospora crassa]